MKDLGYGEDYKYAHDFANNFVPQEFLPDEIVGTSFFQAGSSNREKDIEKTIKNLWGDKYEG